jgi:hypothetical protein
MCDVKVVAREWMTVRAQVFPLLPAATLARLVTLVVGVGTEKKMVWVHTRRRVTLVQDLQTADRAHVRLVGHARRRCGVYW